MWDRRRVGAVAVGGVGGAGARWAISTLAAGGAFPWAILALNVVGSILLGVLLAEEWSHPRARLLLHDVGGIGFCGGLTTFSTYAVDVVELLYSGRPVLALAYAVLSVALTLGGVVVGAGALHQVRAITTPLEEEP